MRRAFPQKVKSVSLYYMAADAVVGQPKQAASGVRRRARTSAAMVGLALSMGASSLLLSRQSDGAAAAEPQMSESAISVVPQATQAAPLVSTTGVVAESPTSVTETINTETINHVVKPGQTLWQIARRYHVALEALATANRLTPSQVLQIGQVLEIPVRGMSGAGELSQASDPSQQSADAGLQAASSDRQLKAQQDDALSRLRQSRASLKQSLSSLRPEEDPKAQVAPLSREVEIPATSASRVSVETAAAASESVTYQVKPGDTLGAIAHTHQVTRRDLAIANRLSDPNMLQVNQSLFIPHSHSAVASAVVAAVPPAAGSTETAASANVYRVSQGDTVGQIANQYNVSQSALVSTNQLGNPNQIVVNQVLTIPVHSGSLDQAATAPSALVDAVAVANDSLQGSPEAVSSLAGSSEYYPMVGVPTVPAVNVPSANTVAAVPPVASQPTSLSDAAAQSAAIATRFVPTQRSGSDRLSQPDARRSTNPYVEHLMTEVLTLRDRYRSEAAQGTTSASRLTAEQPTVVQSTVVATAPIAQPVQTVDPSALSSANSVSSHDQFTQAFQAEVRRLQQEQRRQVQSTPSTDTSATDTSATHTPAQAAPVAVAPVAATPAVVPSRETQGQIVAVAPLGSESYEPLIQPLTGRVVSPNLPPLSGAEAYLPDATPTFNGYRWPTHGVITSGFGWRWGRLHAGIDIGAPIGTPVVAAAAGEIVFSGWNSGGYGNMVDIRHADGSVTRYAHNSRLLVRVGQQVEQGQQISLVGSTGYSTGPHLHFEVHPSGQGAVNPIAYLPRTRES